jgi:hypothetical protein
MLRGSVSAAAAVLAPAGTPPKPVPKRRRPPSRPRPKSKPFDVFLCHNNFDKPKVREVAKELKARGLHPWLDEEQLHPGHIWQAELEKSIRSKSIASAAVFFGPKGKGPWQEFEIEAYLRRFVKDGCPVIPVILPGAKRKPRLPIFLENITWVDFRSCEPPKIPSPLENLIQGIIYGRKRRTPRREA